MQLVAYAAYGGVDLLERGLHLDNVRPEVGLPGRFWVNGNGREHAERWAFLRQKEYCLEREIMIYGGEWLGGFMSL